MAGKLGDAFLAIVPKLDDSAMSKAIGTVQAKLGGAAQAGKVAFAAIGAASTAAMGYVVKSSLDMYSAYEQNVGGIQKIFGNMGKSLDDYAALTGQTADEARDKWSALEESQSAMLENAGKAWQTAGLSASAYMEQSTSFGAALVSSLGGDTRKAVDYANTAIVDMADNANTFGTSIQDIQNAYQGFAKQNYTMLDNLKLGYGGTQSEMKRLIKDASQMTDVQKRLGVTVDASSAELRQHRRRHPRRSGQHAGGRHHRPRGGDHHRGQRQRHELPRGTTGSRGLASSDADMAALTQNLVEAFDNVVSNVVPRIAQIASTVMTELPGVVATVAPCWRPRSPRWSRARWTACSRACRLSSSPSRTASPTSRRPSRPRASATRSRTSSTASRPWRRRRGVRRQPRLRLRRRPRAGARGRVAVVQAIADALSDLLTHVDQVLPVRGISGRRVRRLPGHSGHRRGVLRALGRARSRGNRHRPRRGGGRWRRPAAGSARLGHRPGLLALRRSSRPPIAGVVAVVVALATNAGGCRDMVVGAFTAIAGFVMQAGQTIGSIIITVIGAIGTFVAGVIDGAVSAGSGFVSSIGSFFSQLPGAIGGFLSGAIGAIAGFIGQCASNAASAGSRSSTASRTASTPP